MGYVIKHFMYAGGLANIRVRTPGEACVKAWSRGKLECTAWNAGEEPISASSMQHPGCAWSRLAHIKCAEKFPHPWICKARVMKPVERYGLSQHMIVVVL